MHDGPDGVAAAPRGAVAADVVDPGVRVLPLLAGQEPLTHIHGAHLVVTSRVRKHAQLSACALRRPAVQDAVMDPVAVTRARRLTRAVVYAVVVAVPLGHAGVPRPHQVRPAGDPRPGRRSSPRPTSPRSPPVPVVRRDLGGDQPAVGDVPAPRPAGVPLRLVRQAPADPRLVGAVATMAVGWAVAAVLKLARAPGAPRDRRPVRPARRATRSRPVTPPTTPSSSPWSSCCCGPSWAPACGGCWSASARSG